MNSFDFAWMIGRHAVFSFSEPTTWFVAIENSLGVNVECPWRLLHEGKIFVSSEDHKQQFDLTERIDAEKRANSSLEGLAIIHVEMREGTADLLISFEQDWKLELIPLSSGYESWQVTTPSGKTVVAQGGGQLTLS